MNFKLYLVLFLLLISSTSIASEWVGMPGRTDAFYADNGGSKSVMFIGDHGIDIVLITVNSQCKPGHKRKTGTEYMYVNQTMIQFSYVCSDDFMSVYVANSKKGKGYILNSFIRNKKTCFAVNKDASGLCFGNEGFEQSREKLKLLEEERKKAL